MSQGSILVTGGAGYIGSHTVVALIEAGYTPVIIDDFRNANRSVLKGIESITGEKVLVFERDVTDKKEMDFLFKKIQPSGIIHFAAYKAVGESVHAPLKYYQNNLIGLMNLLELSLHYQIRSFVFSSSCTVYGEPSGNFEVDESSPIGKPASPYGQTKVMGEQIIHDVCRANPWFNALNLRYFNPVGAHPSAAIGEFPQGKPSNLLPYITQTAIGKLAQLTVFGGDYNTLDGTCLRDYIHVCDLAEAHVKGLQYLEQQKGGEQAINIGTGKATSVLEMIHLFEEVTGNKLNWNMGERRAGDVPMICAKIEKASKLLHWSASYSIEDAIAHAWDWENNIAFIEK
jgi:UDP-glucose 4-epimerase